MKRNFIVLILLVSAFLPACGDDTTETPTPGDSTGGCDNLDDQGNCIDELE